MAEKRTADDVLIGKFDILATYEMVGSLLDGRDEAEAKQRGMVAAIMGARARLGGGDNNRHDDFKARKEAAERKRKTTITAESFDHQVADKMGAFFDADFLPLMKRFVAGGFSYDDVKRTVKIPGVWGAKIRGEEFRERASAALGEGGAG